MLTYKVANDILKLLLSQKRVYTQGSGSTPDNSFPGSVYIGLSSTEPERDGTNITEPDKATTGYERAMIEVFGNAQVSKMSTPVDGASENVETIFFEKALVDYPETITHFILFKDKTSTAVGDVVAYGALKTPINPKENEVPIIEKGNLVITVDPEE